jgi:D-alanyl-D-alanine carboxypeptidase/D-alanyl-D-alanine-endopeptidase (penicillin-binding protein 4)
MKPMRFLLALLIPLLAAETAKPPVRRISTERRIDTILNTEEAKGARWGIHVVSLKQNKAIYQRNADEHFTPASNTKLFSTSLALERLGPEHRFVTTLRTDRAPINGVIRGDLRLVGGGDPTLSGRVYPYVKDAERGDPAEPIEQLARQLIDRGIREIQGDIVGDDRLYVFAP